MQNVGSNNLWIVYVTILIAFMMSAIPLPLNVYWLWPEWVVLVVLYWVLALPSKFNLGLAFVAGVMIDLLQSNFLGVNALAMLLTVYIAALLYRRMRMYTPWQQSGVVFVLVFINQMVNFIGQGLGGNTTSLGLVLGSALVSCLIWSWVFLVLRAIRQGFNVH